MESLIREEGCSRFGGKHVSLSPAKGTTPQSSTQFPAIQSKCVHISLSLPQDRIFDLLAYVNQQARSTIVFFRQTLSLD